MNKSINELLTDLEAKVEKSNFLNNDIKGLVDLIRKKHESPHEPIPVYNFQNSLILDRKLGEQLEHLCEFPSDQQWVLIYRGSDDGFGAKDFHAKCDHVRKNLTIIKSIDGYIFGGYTDESWDGACYKLDMNAFLFSLINKANKPIKIKYDNTFKENHSIFCHPAFGPSFGAGIDLHISDNSNINLKSYSKLCYSYMHPFYINPQYGLKTRYALRSHKANSFLAGKENFQAKEIEIYCKIRI